MTDHVFDKIVDRLAQMDPVYFAEKYLTLDGKPYRINKSGYKPFADIMRYVGVKALEKESLPIVILKARQAGVSTLAAALEMYFMASPFFGNGGNPPMRIMHVFPQLDIAYAYSKTKLGTMISSSIVDPNQLAVKGQKPKSYMQSLIDTSSPSNDSLQFKQFVGGNHLWIDSTGIDAARLRGRSADCMIFDEVQAIPAQALGNATKILAKAQYGSPGNGIRLFFGTPLMRGSAFWDIWQQSSQQYYHLGCAKCKKHFPLYTPGSNDWEDTWLYGFTVRCSFCGHEQDKLDATERGKWIATKDPAECKFIGYHINQLYMYDFTKEKIIAEKPGISAINTERAYQNEVLGEFYSGEATIITPDQVRELCGDPERKMRESISPAEETLVFMGIDIGAKNDLEQLSDKAKSQGQSYSTAVIIAMTGPQRMSIERAVKFKRNDFASKKGIIDELMRKYSVNLAVCDIGYAGDLNEVLQTEYGDKMLASQASPRVNNKTKFNDSVFPKVIAFERDYWIADFYEQMKKGNLRIPLGSYEQISWLIDHLTSYEIKASISRTGDVSPHYVKGSHPVDGFSAALNAYIAYKFYISSGFKIIHPSMMSDTADKKPPMIFTKITGMR